MRLRIVKDPAEALRHCCSHHWRLSVLRAPVRERLQELGGVSGWDDVPIGLQDTAHRAAAHPAHGLAGVLEGLAQQAKLPVELLFPVCHVEILREQGKGVLQQPCCILAHLPVCNLEATPQERAIKAAEQFVDLLIGVAVAVKLLEHGARLVSTLPGTSDGQGRPLLNAVLDLHPGAAIRCPPCFEQPDCVGLKHRGPGVHDLVLHGGVHLGREAGVDGVEEAEHVRAVLAPDEVGAQGASQELVLQGLDGLMLPVKLAEQVADLVEPADIGRGHLRFQALSN
mmetsp:Transcript_85200/g.264732  ORF Transcript_85200/g.264732 Transcript_85200/m.264732 type:complete len:283 (-) Transcript_85200:571-1419(-)